MRIKDVPLAKVFCCLRKGQIGIPVPCLGHHCGRTDVQQRETETGRLPKRMKAREERDKRHNGKGEKGTQRLSV